MLESPSYSILRRTRGKWNARNMLENVETTTHRKKSNPQTDIGPSGRREKIRMFNFPLEHIENGMYGI